LLEVERLSRDCMLADDDFQKINCPIALNGKRASGMRFADPRVHPLWYALILFRLLANGFHSADLRHHLAALSGYTPRRSFCAPFWPRSSPTITPPAKSPFDTVEARITAWLAKSTFQSNLTHSHEIPFLKQS
jgi:hypothetical protein